MDAASASHTGARRWWALGAVSLSTVAVGVDGTVLSVALHTLSNALHASEFDLECKLCSFELALVD